MSLPRSPECVSSCNRVAKKGLTTNIRLSLVIKAVVAVQPEGSLKKLGSARKSSSVLRNSCFSAVA